MWGVEITYLSGTGMASPRSARMETQALPCSQSRTRTQPHRIHTYQHELESKSEFNQVQEHALTLAAITANTTRSRLHLGVQLESHRYVWQVHNAAHCVHVRMRVMLTRTESKADKSKRSERYARMCTNGCLLACALYIVQNNGRRSPCT